MTLSNNDIPLGDCQCGCGTKTNIVKVTNLKLGRIAGLPYRYASGHSPKIRRVMPVEDAIPFKIDGVYCRLVPLSREFYAIVWEIDYERVAIRKWYAQPTPNGYYAVRRAWKEENLTGRTEYRVRMHTFILPPPDGLTVDHISGCTLDNRRSNLRIATMLEQTRNRKRVSTTNHLWKGYVRTKSNKFQAHIYIDNKEVYGGIYETEMEAAIAHDALALKHFGEFARLNFTTNPLMLNSPHEAASQEQSS